MIAVVGVAGVDLHTSSCFRERRAAPAATNTGVGHRFEKLATKLQPPVLAFQTLLHVNLALGSIHLKKNLEFKTSQGSMEPK